MLKHHSKSVHVLTVAEVPSSKSLLSPSGFIDSMSGTVPKPQDTYQLSTFTSACLYLPCTVSVYTLSQLSDSKLRSGNGAAENQPRVTGGRAERWARDQRCSWAYPGNLHNQEEVIQLQLNRLLKYKCSSHVKHIFEVWKIQYFTSELLPDKKKNHHPSPHSCPQKSVSMVSSLTAAGIYTNLSRRPQVHFYNKII